MKYILSVTLLLFAVLGTTIAQDEKSAAEFKNDGNAALKSKDYKGALTAYESAIAAWDEAEDMDAAMVYNAATCARKLKNDEKTIKFYQQAKDLGYKGDLSTYYIALSQKNLGKSEEMEATLLKGIEDYPSSKYLKYMNKELSQYYVLQANDFYTKGQKLLNTRTDANRDQWDAIKGNAKTELDKAVELANKSLKYNASNEAAKTIVTNTPELLK